MLAFFCLFPNAGHDVELQAEESEMDFQYDRSSAYRHKKVCTRGSEEMSVGEWRDEWEWVAGE